MNLKASSLVALVALGAAPLASQAGDTASNAAFDACIKAFTTTYVPNHTIRDVKTNTAYSSSTLAFWKPSTYTVELRARGVNSNSTVAEARCRVDRQGVVLVQEGSAATVIVTEAER